MEDLDYNPVVPDHVPPGLVYDYNIADCTSEDPFLRVYEMYQEGVPEIFWTRNIGGHWCVLSAEAITELNETDPKIISAVRSFIPDYQNADPPVSPPLTAEPPLHTAYRSALAPLFTPQRMLKLEGQIRELSRDLIARIKERGECEFMEDFAAVLPPSVFLHIMDMPLEDASRLQKLTEQVTNPNLAPMRNRNTPIAELDTYIEQYITERIAKPGDDPVSHVVRSQIIDRPIEFIEAIQLSRTILLAGFETTVSQLGFFAHHLAETPETRRLLIEQPQMMSKVIEEIIRRYGIAPIGRCLEQDFVYRGVKMKAGDHIVWPVRAYNLDPKMFEDPMTIRFDRPHNRHSSFGTKSHHFCVGASLARLELRLFAEEWLAAIPDFHVKPNTPPSYQDGRVVRYKDLPLVVGAP
jgi:camphor 5-monooxygenase